MFEEQIQLQFRSFALNPFLTQIFHLRMRQSTKTSSKMLSSISLLSLSLGSALAQQYHFPPEYRIDVHRHAIPKVWYNALITAGNPIIDGTLTVDGFPVPGDWNITAHIAEMDIQGINYNMLSLNSPTVDFLADNVTAAADLARKINIELHSYTQLYPDRLGALCVLPLPNVAAAIIEIEVQFLFTLQIFGQN